MTNDSRSEALLKPYAIITERICAMLGQGVVPWRQPWNPATAEPASLASGKAYRGMNVFLLEASAAMGGYRSRYWVTFKQALERGGNVRKGEQATPVVFWKILERHGDRKKGEREADEEPAPDGRKIPILKYYNVFNAEQCEGLEYPAPRATEVHPFDPIETCEQIVQAMPRPPTIEHRGNRACYLPTRDEVLMPARESFKVGGEYYSTLFHELVHATGHPSRLDREAIAKPSGFGTDPYAKEELVAEMGAAFLCSRARIEQVTLENSAAYIQGWLGKLRGDPKLVVMAAAAAQKAADYVLGDLAREPKSAVESNGTLAARVAEEERARSH